MYEIVNIVKSHRVFVLNVSVTHLVIFSRGLLLQVDTFFFFD